MPWKVACGDCLELLKAVPDESMDSIVSDPPAGISFMGREWDSNKGGRDPWIDWMTRVMKEGFRVLKPGAHILIWAIPRTSHWTATAIEDAGFEVRDCLTHHFGSGFPKSQDVGKFIDKLAGAEREVVGVDRSAKKLTAGKGTSGLSQVGCPNGEYEGARVDLSITAPATDEAQTWDGWGTALKPATEHWILARKPLSESSIARNVLKHGTGALNIDGCRVERDAGDVPGWHKSGANGSAGYQGEETFRIREMSAEEIQERCGGKGRWPTNLLLSHDETCGFEDGECHPQCPVAELDRQSGSRPGSYRTSNRNGDDRSLVFSFNRQEKRHDVGYSDSGGASRFFPTFHYFPKPSRSEREAGLAELPDRTLNRVNPGGLENEPRFAPITVKNNHPTVKGKKLMSWLIRLITPPGGWVLDPFAGSGSTGVAAVSEGFQFFGIEKEPNYAEIAEKRIQFADAEAGGQMSLFDEEEF